MYSAQLCIAVNYYRWQTLVSLTCELTISQKALHSFAGIVRCEFSRSRRFNEHLPDATYQVGCLIANCRSSADDFMVHLLECRHA